MRKLSALILGLASVYAVSQEKPKTEPLFPYSTELQVEVPVRRASYMDNDSIRLAELNRQFLPGQRRKSYVFYQDLKDFYDNNLFSLYLKFKHPIPFNNPAWQFEMHDISRGGIRIILDHPKEDTKLNHMKSLYDRLYDTLPPPK